MSTLRALPIDPSKLALLRATGRDEFGTTIEYRTDAEGGSQLRCCLTLSEPEAAIALIGFAPPGARGAWRESGPVYIHAEPCPGYDRIGTLPAWLDEGARVLRGYDAEGAMQYASNRLVRAGHGVAAAAAEMLSDHGVAAVHVRNALSQCFIATVVAPSDAATPLPGAGVA